MALRKLIDHSQPASEFEPPKTATEELLHSVWEQALGHDAFGVTDHFFDVGGDSLKAMNVAGELDDRMIHVALSDVFRHTTIRKLAEFINQQCDQTGHLSDFSTPHNRTAQPQLSPGQKSIWAFGQLNPNSTAYNIHVRLHFPVQLDAEKLREGFEAIVARHESLRTAVTLIDGQPNMDIASHVEAPFTMEKLADSDVSARLHTEAKHCFDLASAPLIRLLLIHTPVGSWVALTSHHLIIDQHSSQLLLNELFAIYDGNQLASVQH